MTIAITKLCQNILIMEMGMTVAIIIIAVLESPLSLSL